MIVSVFQRTRSSLRKPMGKEFSAVLLLVALAHVPACASKTSAVAVPPRSSASNAPPIVTASNMPPVTSPGRTRVTLAVRHPERRLLGENVLVDYCVENTSPETLIVNFGGDYRGGTRSGRFRVKVTDAKGTVLDDPDPDSYNLGGLMMDSEIRPGRSYCRSLPVHRYARIDDPGTYTIRVTHDLGWPAGTAPSGETSVTFAMPSDAEAAEVLEEMAAQAEAESGSAGERTRPYPDFTALRYPIYLSHLEKLAGSGDERAIAGIGQIPTVDATRALLRLVDAGKPAIAKPARGELAMRLPDPALTGSLGPRNPFFNEMTARRRYLSRLSWHPDLAAGVRDRAKKLLASSDDAETSSGAFFLEAVGTPADNPPLLDALNRAIAKTATVPRETHVSPPPRGACQELRRAARMLLERGLGPADPPRSLGEFAEWLEGFQSSWRPPKWESTLHAALHHSNLYVRRIAFESMSEVPPNFSSDVGDNLNSADRDVQVAAVSLAQQAKLTALGPRVAALISSTRDEWLLGTVWSAAQALDARLAATQALVGRLTDPTVAERAMGHLLDLFGTNGHSGGELEPKEARAVQARWTAYIATHKTEISTGKVPLVEETKSLVPKSFSLSRDGQPDWPRPRPDTTDSP